MFIECLKVSLQTVWMFIIFNIYRASDCCIMNPALRQRFVTRMQVWTLWSEHTSVLLSGKPAMPGVEHAVTYTICYLQFSWLEQTLLCAGNGADKKSDLDTVFLCVTRDRLMSITTPFDFSLWRTSSRIPCCLETFLFHCRMKEGSLSACWTAK